MEPFRLNEPLKTVLVLDGEQRSSLATVRSLGRKGIRVIVGSAMKTSLAGCSRYAQQTIQYRDPYVWPRGFVEDVIRVIRQEKIDALIPMTDLSVYLVLKHEDELRRLTAVPFPDFDTYRQATDKLDLMRRASAIGVPIPETLFVEDPPSAMGLSGKIRYPAVLKPGCSIFPDNGRYFKACVRLVHCGDDLKDALASDPSFRRPFMIQQRLEGEGTGVFAFYDKGRPTAVFSHRRLREKPPWGGVSVLSESCDPDPLATAGAFRLLESLRWKGAAMVEFKRDRPGGVPHLMEINARLWGSLQLAIDCGVDFPYFLYLLSQGAPVPDISGFRPSRLRWFLGDIDHLWIYLNRCQRDPRLSPCRPWSRGRAVFSFIKEFSRRGTRLEVLRMDDPVPFLWEVREHVQATRR